MTDSPTGSWRLSGRLLLGERGEGKEGRGNGAGGDALMGGGGGAATSHP